MVQLLFSSLTHICVTRPQCVNGLSPAERKATACTNGNLLKLEPVWTPYSNMCTANHHSLIRNVFKNFFFAKQQPFRSCITMLIHWGRVTYICASKLISIGSYNSLSSGRRHAISLTNAGLSLTRPLGLKKNNEIIIENHTFSFTKIHWKMWSGKWHFVSASIC